MHIFCDESGASSENWFIVAGVCIARDEATKVIRRFRKAAKLKGEVHGHELIVEHRELFFQYLKKQSTHFAAVVVCSREDALGGWAMNSLKRVRLES